MVILLVKKVIVLLTGCTGGVQGGSSCYTGGLTQWHIYAGYFKKGFHQGVDIDLKIGLIAHLQVLRYDVLSFQIVVTFQ